MLMLNITTRCNYVLEPCPSSWRVYLIPIRFEKSLYDLIRGLRNHRGNEREYIQNSLRECRAEIRGSDMGISLNPVPPFTVDL